MIDPGAGVGIYGVIGVIGIILGLLKEIASLVLIIQGVRLVNFIIRNKGLNNIKIENIIEKEDPDNFKLESGDEFEDFQEFEDLD